MAYDLISEFTFKHHAYVTCAFEVIAMEPTSHKGLTRVLGIYGAREFDGYIMTAGFFCKRHPLGYGKSILDKEALEAAIASL